jgi:U32 family peptidase
MTQPPTINRLRPEVLAPAGDLASMQAAIHAGADAVYFGLAEFNARARATNFEMSELERTIKNLHRYGVQGYVTLNTVLFDAELPRMEKAIEACARAGVDAIIVQDLGVVKLARAIAPHLHIHASTQMTCTDAASCELARELGVSRVILARELSVDDIREIRKGTSVELEVFVHGALCIAYSGQCLTSEAVGGRSANRGACAQACRLPYQLVVDGVLQDLGSEQYLLSPQDLEASAVVADLADAGIRSLKIEGRLKGADYVTATVRLYREALDAWEQRKTLANAPRIEQALQTFSRGSSHGFFRGVDHQALVPGDSSDHRGPYVGKVLSLYRNRGRTELVVTPSIDLVKGDGVLIQGEKGERGELGGRIWEISSEAGEALASAPAQQTSRIWLGPERAPDPQHVGRALFRSSNPHLSAALAKEPGHRVPLTIRVSGAEGEPLTVRAESERGHIATVTTEANLERGREGGLDHAKLSEKLGKLGGTPFILGKLESALQGALFVAPSQLNEARRALVIALETSTHTRLAATAPSFEATAVTAPKKNDAAKGIFVLCRNHAQAQAALTAGASGVGLDYLELTGTGDSFRTLRAQEQSRGVELRVAPPRIRKPKEEKIDAFLRGLSPDAVMVRGLGALHELRSHDGLETTSIGDFSLNVTNRHAAQQVLDCGLSFFTPAFDLDETQLLELLSHSGLAARAEVVIHHAMPLFYMEHCVFAALLSEGKDYLSCGRPCDRHVVSLRDRAGFDHPLEADVGCRNTVFHAKPQSAVHLIPKLQALGVTRFRIEAVRETPEQVASLIEIYRDLFEGTTDLKAALRLLGLVGSSTGYGVIKGSLRVLT